MDENINFPEDLSKEGLAHIIIDFFHRIMMHHAMWYAEVQHQYGRERALEILKEVYDKSYGIQMKRLSKTIGFKMKENIPEPLLEMDQEKLNELKDKVAANWLANDGIWFQALEFSMNIFDAKKCNDLAWAQFSPFEAWSIKRYLNLPQKSGLEGLKKALQFRVYACLNKQSISDERPNSFVFRMNECRVQATRKLKGLDDYPCKSGGLVEYSSFAKEIDPKIKTECLGCPPDDHPNEWHCAWRFYTMEES